MTEKYPPSAGVRLDILDQDQYFIALTQDVATAQSGDQISMTTMSLEPSETAVQEVMGGLNNAAERGVDVNFALDAYTFLTDSTSGTFGPLFSRKFGKNAVYDARRATFDELASKSAVNAGIVNTPNRQYRNPFANRSHIKAATVGDITYIGGPNLHGTERSDMVLRIEDAQFAGTVHQMIADLAITGSTTHALGGVDYLVPIDHRTDLLVDTGTRNQSVIMDTALQAIDRAEEQVVVASQFLPSKRVMSRLRAAHKKGVEVHIVRNHPENETGIKKAWQLGMLAFNRLQLPADFFQDVRPCDVNPSHIAAVATEKEVLKGGHNFNDLGVKWGTAEAVIHRRNDPDFARDVAAFVLNQAPGVVVDDMRTPEIKQLALEY